MSQKRHRRTKLELFWVKRQFKNLYESGVKIESIQTELSLATSTVYDWIAELGLERRRT